jgi:hypothetical protein
VSGRGAAFICISQRSRGLIEPEPACEPTGCSSVWYGKREIDPAGLVGFVAAKRVKPIELIPKQ